MGMTKHYKHVVICFSHFQIIHSDEEISRWQLEGGSRKRDSYSEILERHWRHTLQAKPPRRGKTLTLHTSSQCRASPIHVKQRNQEGYQASSCPHPDGLGRLRQGELSGTMVLPQTTLGQSSIAPWTDQPPPGKKEKLSNKQ
jgi:hypothetical protein